jgi:hypothetical protein
MNKLKRMGLAAALVVPMIGGTLLTAPAASAAPACQPATKVKYDPHPGAIALQTSFETGTLEKFLPRTSGTGTATVSPAQRRSGACSAYLHATADAGSVAMMSTRSLPSGSREVYADGWFNMTKAGLPDSDVPYFRVFNGSARVMDVHRSNSDGQLWLRVASLSGSFDYIRLGGVAAGLGAWHHLVLHAVLNGPTSTAEVWFDGQLLLSSNNVSTGHKALTRVQLGAEHPRQMGDTYIDDVSITVR